MPSDAFNFICKSTRISSDCIHSNVTYSLLIGCVNILINYHQQTKLLLFFNCFNKIMALQKSNGNPEGPTNEQQQFYACIQQEYKILSE